MNLDELIRVTEDATEGPRGRRDFDRTFDPPRVLKLLAVARAAEEWWLNKRPVAWAEEEHLRNPTINCATGAEYALALAVAALRDFREAS